MADPEIPLWLKGLPLAPEYRPTETEFADPIAFISRIEREAAAFGICKVIPPLPKPSKKFVLSNLNRSLSKSADPGPGSDGSDATLFTTRQQELGARKTRPAAVHKQVWQSGERYTLEQFEAKSKAFARSYLGGFKEVNPLLVETLFWKAASEKPVYVEYANDVPGSGFAEPEKPLRYCSHRRKRKRGVDGGRRVEEQPKRPCPVVNNEGKGEREGTAGWMLSNSPWNLQVIARSPGSITRFMPDEVPGVTSPMVYIGMLFSWFAWHVEDHELHSLNFLHMGSPKTWYAIPGDYANTVEEIVRVQGYGGNVDRLAAFTMLGEKTTLLSPEVFVSSGVPCCRLVQNPGEFVVTFPRAYHVGFSHGFNCGEAANFATPQWLKVAKEAAVRRAAMNYLPMLSHQQLLYLLTMSFVSRVPRALLSGVRSSRLKDRKREDRETLVKKAFLNDMMNENNLLCVLLSKESTSYAVLWEPDLLPSLSPGSQSFGSSSSLGAEGSVADIDQGKERIRCEVKDQCSVEGKTDDGSVENLLHEASATLTSVPCYNISVDTRKNACDADCISSSSEFLESIDVDDDDLPFGLNVDSGSLACVACGILGYPFMAIVQPSERASRELFTSSAKPHQSLGKSACLTFPSCPPSTASKFESETGDKFEDPDSSFKVSPAAGGHAPVSEETGARSDSHILNDDIKTNSSDAATIPQVIVEEGGDIMGQDGHQLDELNPKIESTTCSSRSDSEIYHSNELDPCDGLKECGRSANMKVNAVVENNSDGTSFSNMKPSSEIDRQLVKTNGDGINEKWTTSLNGFMRPRIFCLQHALEIEELLHSKGGAHVLVICHSDYIKIKAYATSIAEETGTQFNFKDVPLENASPADLDLINISIDDENEQQDEDWTSKLGVNLRYCVKVRKQSASNQEQLSLALGRIFADPLPVRAVSALKWSSRKSRTPYKVVGISQTNSATNGTLETGDPVVRNSDAVSPTKLQVYRSRRKDSSDMTIKHDSHHKKGIPSEFGKSKETAKVDSRDDRRTSGHARHQNEKVEVDNMGSLFTVPISAVENLQMYQDCWVPLKVCTSNGLSNIAKSDNVSASELCTQSNELNDTKAVSDCVRYERAQSYIKVTVFESSEMHQEIHSAEESGTKCKLGNFKKSEFQENIMEAEGKSFDSERRLEVRATDEINSRNELQNTVDSGNDSTLGAVAFMENLQNTTVAQEPNLESGFGNCLLSADPHAVPVVLHDNSEMQLEVSTAEDLKHGGSVDISPEPEGKYINNVSAVEKFGMQQEEIPSAENNVPVEIYNMQLENQLMTDVLMVSSEMQQEFHLGNETEENKEVIYSVSSKGQSVEDTDANPVLENSVNLTHTPAVSAVKSSTLLEDDATPCGDHSLDNGIQKDKRNLTIVEIKPYVRRRLKRKREEERKRVEEQPAESNHSCTGFIRSPCEGLRPRTKGTMASVKVDLRTVGKKGVAKVTKRPNNSMGGRGKDNGKELYECDIEGCRMTFRTRSELQLHKRNRCTVEGCGKRFASHKYAMRHQHVHNDERPLKCPWRGCNMSFKWAWARTEHVRIHTGERPYKCMVAGCELTFRFVSDFSRHRRKTGHSFSSLEQ